MNLSEADKGKLRAALAVRASLTGNVLNLIGLDEVRERYPQMWERNRERIVETTRAIITQFTDPTIDIVLPLGGANFAVVYTRLDKQEALLRTAAIKSEILRRFMGDEALEPLSVQVQELDLDAQAVRTGTLAELLASARSEAPRDRPDRPRPKDPKAPLSPKAARAYRASMEELLGHAALPVDAVASRFEFSFDTLEFGFQPFLYLSKGMFTVFACRAVRYGLTGDIVTGYSVLPRDADLEQITTLDKMVLMRARHGLVDMAVRKRAAVVVIPVSFETMTGRGTAAEYLALLQKVPSDLRNYLVPTLCRCPSGVPQGRLAELINPLRRFCRAAGMRLESPTESLSGIKGAGASSIGISLRDTARTDWATKGTIERIVSNARKLGLLTFVDGVDTPEIAARCEALGVDYLGGREYAELSDYVGPITERLTR